MAQPACHLPSHIIISVEVLLVDTYCPSIHFCWISLLTAGESLSCCVQNSLCSKMLLHLPPGCDDMRGIADDFLRSPGNLPCSTYVVVRGLWHQCVWQVCWKLTWCFAHMLGCLLKTGCTARLIADSVQTQHTLSGHFSGFWEFPNSRTEFTSPLFASFLKKSVDRNWMAHYIAYWTRDRLDLLCQCCGFLCYILNKVC